jgi:hypothetical protein
MTHGTIQWAPQTSTSLVMPDTCILIPAIRSSYELTISIFLPAISLLWLAISIIIPVVNIFVTTRQYLHVIPMSNNGGFCQNRPCSLSKERGAAFLLSECSRWNCVTPYRRL